MNPPLIQNRKGSGGSFPWIQGKPGAGVRAAPAGGGLRGPMPTAAQEGLGSSPVTSSSSMVEKSSIFFILESVISVPKAPRGLNWETQVLNLVSLCVILGKSILSDSVWVSGSNERSKLYGKKLVDLGLNTSPLGLGLLIYKM